MEVYQQAFMCLVVYCLGWYVGYLSGTLVTQQKFLRMIKAAKPKVADLFPSKEKG